MREIKFRGWNERLKIWAYGYYTHNGKTHLIHVDKEYKTGTVTHGGAYEVEPETVGQFTGLKDSEGREIYEGDILSLHEGSDEMIKVIDFYAAITALDFSEMINLRLLNYYFERGEVHVIGNVYDNPELLEVEHD